MANLLILWMTFSIWGRTLITSETSMLLLLMSLQSNEKYLEQSLFLLIGAIPNPQIINVGWSILGKNNIGVDGRDDVTLFQYIMHLIVEIIVCLTPSFIGSISHGKLMLTRIIQERIKKLAFHWKSMSDLFKVYSWCWYI